MNCPTTDKLSQFVDELLTGEEHSLIKKHIECCNNCKRTVTAYEEEQQFLKDTLQTPVLPDDFASAVLEQLEPYENKVSNKKKPARRRVFALVAGIILTFGIGATFDSSFAKWIGGLFSTDQVDEGLRMAKDAGFGERVNREVIDKGIIFKVEDVVADSSRVALSYQILKENGKILDSYLDPHENGNDIYIADENGNRLDMLTMGWSEQNEYGFIEFSLREYEVSENVTVKFDLVELNGTKGEWKLEIPIDLKNSLASTKILALDDGNKSFHGVNVRMKEVRFAPSSNEIMYETAFTKEVQADIEKQIKQLEKKFGNDNVNTFTNYGTAIEYHIENEKGQAVSHHNTFFKGKGHPSDLGLLQGSGRPLGKIGQMAWNESFIPQKGDNKLSFVLDGVFKTVPADFEITFKPGDLKNNPLSFEYEGNYMMITDADKHNDYSLRKSLIPIKKETTFKIEMEGGKEALASDLGAWVLTDNKGKSYMTYKGSSILDEKDENGRFKTTIELTIYNMEEIPEELTLHLLSVTRYEEVKDKWQVPLY